MHAESEGLANQTIVFQYSPYCWGKQGGPPVHETWVSAIIDRLSYVLATFPFLGVNSGIGTYDCSMSNFGSSINALNLQVHVNYHAIIFI